MESLAVTLLGTLQVSCGGQVISTFESVRVRALLAYLVVEADRSHTRSLLATLLWPELPEEVSRGNLRQALANLRRVLDRCMVESPLIVTREAVQWNQASSNWLDVSAFSALLDAVALHPHRNTGSCSSCARQLTQAMELYSGDFLEHFYLPDSEPFEEWALVKREHLQRRALGALERLTEYHARRGAYEEARKYRLRQVELAPWYEDAHYDLMRLHLLLGERSAALAQYHSCRRLLMSELGVEPAEATKALYEEIRNWRADWGDQSRLARPASQIPSSNLPSAPNRFVGRGDLLARLIDLLEDPSRRLVTLVGAPGIGKTRLALEAAAQHAYSFADGALFVSLAPVERADLVTSTLARALGVQETASGRLEDHLVSYLRGRELLLVLDNFEHVISASTVVRELLDGAPHLQVMTTSRQPLGLYGEQLFAVPPLAMPDTESRQDTEHLLDYEAIQLFVERARAVDASFALTRENAPVIASICARLEGLPLAIELAAARAGDASLQEMLSHLANRFEWLATSTMSLPSRHQTLRAAIDWSFQLVDASEQQLFARLGVFAGDFALEAVQEVAPTASGGDSNVEPWSRKSIFLGAPSPHDPDHGSTLDPALMNRLSALVDKSFLLSVADHEDELRLAMLDTMRDYALSQLEQMGEAQAASTRHLGYFLRLAEVAWQELRGPRAAHWFKLLDVEYDNLRAALQWALEGDVALALRLAVALGEYWDTRGLILEGRRWLERALSQAESTPALVGAPPALLAVAEMELGRLLFRNAGEYPAALALMRRAQAWAREAGDAFVLADALGLQGMVAVSGGDFPGAALLLEESLAISQQIGYEMATINARQQLAIGAMLQGRYLEAIECAREALIMARRAGASRWISISLSILGYAELCSDNAARAQQLFAEALGWRWQVDDRGLIVYELAGLAGTLAAQGRAVEAARLLGKVDRLFSRTGTSSIATLLPYIEGTKEVARGQLGDALYQHAWDQGHQMSLAQMVTYALGAGESSQNARA